MALVLPVHALGDSFDHQIALGKQWQVFIVVGGVDVLELCLAGQRGRVEFLQTIQRLPDDTVLVAFLGRQVEQNDRHIRIGEVRGNLRPHHAGAKHGGFLHNQLVQAFLLQMLLFRSSHA